MRYSLWVLGGLGALALFGSFLGAMHPAGDALAVIRLQLSAAELGAGVLLTVMRVRWGWVLAAGALAVLGVTLGPLTPLGAAASSAVSGVTVYQKNLLFRLSDSAPLIADIRAVAPDVLTLQEVSHANRAILAELGTDFPSQQFCRFGTVGGVAVASRWPLIPDTGICQRNDGLVAMQVQTPNGPLWLVSIHLHWPWPRDQAAQAAQVAQLLPTLEKLDGPVIVGGDFNMVPWGSSVQRIAAATGTTRQGGIYSSFPRFAPWGPLPIDHVLTPGVATIELRPLLGSDHRGLVARVFAQ